MNPPSEKPPGEIATTSDASGILQFRSHADAIDPCTFRDTWVLEGHETVAASPVLQGILAKIPLIARSKIPVLIQGETGTGKELIARMVHANSPRRANHFVQVNCAAFSDSLIESDLFGHEKGAFTGAAQQHAGYFERADGGSILLDEIGEMRPNLQAKLLRILEEETFERVGGERLLKVDIRVIATTNRDLEDEISQMHFRSDLYYRLNTATITLPPLRERLEEVTALTDWFILKYGRQGDRKVSGISPSALARLREYDWPGNIRQLRNVVHFACVCCQSGRIELQDLPPLLSGGSKKVEALEKHTLADIEKARILEVLKDVGGNRTIAARRLGITTRTLQNKLKQYREIAA